MAEPRPRTTSVSGEHRESAFFDPHAATYRDAVNASIAITGDSVDHFARLKAELVAAELSDPTGLRVLDFGCGTGLSTTALAAALPAARTVCGVDPSGASIAIAKRGQAPGIEYKVMSDAGLQFRDGSFDVVFTACVFHHIERVAHARWLAEVHRVLAPGGSCFIFEHNPANPLTRRAVRACPFDDGVVLLASRYTEGLLRSAGFSVAPPRYYYFFPRALAALRGLESGLRWLPLGAQYYVRGRKPIDAPR